jgi:subtilisin family serine protease
MSFGWPSSSFDGHDVLENAIHNAYGKKVLLFAAASNSGGQLSRAYPASSSQVICVHSTDALGNASAFNPTAHPHALNFATIGESVESAWPIHKFRHDKLSPQRHVKCRSGTSYATPIMAGIAAFLLQYARIHLSAEEALKFKTKENMEALLKRCAERGPNYATRDGYFYVQLSLNRHNLFGGKLEDISYEISKTLQK